MRQENLAPVSRNQKLMLYTIERMPNAAVNIDMRAVFLLTDDSMKKGIARELFCSSFSIVRYVWIRDSCPVRKKSSPYKRSHHWEDKTNETASERHRTRVVRKWHLLHAIFSFLESSDNISRKRG